MNRTSDQNIEDSFSFIEDSFSFSLNELKSTLKDVDIPQDQEEEEEQEEDEESYIEIDLLSGELELRISFSSLPNSSNWLSAHEGEESSHRLTNDHDGRTPCPSFRFPITRSFSSSMSSARPSISHDLLPTWESSPKGDNSIGRAGASLKGRGKAKVSPSELAGSSPSTSPEEYGRLIGKTRNRALVGSRKPFRVTTTLSGGVLMKFLIKLRSGKLLSTFMSFIKSYTFPPHLFKASHHKNKRETLWKYPRLSNPFQKWMALINTTYRTDNDDDDVVAAGNRVIAKMEASKVIEIMDSNKTVKCKKGRFLTSSKSLPVTRTASPARSRGAGNETLGKLGVEERDCSVRAAIAHCKRSFGEGIGR